MMFRCFVCKSSFVTVQMLIRLVTEDFQTLCFAEHFHSFHVTQGNDQNVSMLKVDKLHFFKPFDLQTTYGFDRDYLWF